MTRALYHFTSLSRWSSIQGAGLLEPRSRQAVSFYDDRPVLWLSDNPTGSSSTGVAADRADVRISVHTPRSVHPWVLYREEVPGRGINLTTEGSDPDSWFVTSVPVGGESWSSAVRLDTGEVLWSGEVVTYPLGPTNGWSLPDHELWAFQDFVTAAVRSMAETGALHDADLLQWSVQVFPRQVERLVDWATRPGEDVQFRAWVGWQSLREKAEQVPDLPVKWRVQ